MNSYERIQNAIDYIEENLRQPLGLEAVASRAFFSLSQFYRMFHALTGHTVKDYIRKRRLSEAAHRLVFTDDRIIDICFDYCFEYQESFTRAFSKMFGSAPGSFRKNKELPPLFEQLDLIEHYFAPNEQQAPADPRIKVLKEIPPMRVASCRAVSATPEHDAWRTLMDWADKNGLLAPSRPYRLFGFDNPGPSENCPTHGYEFWITAGPDIDTSKNIEIKEFPGGLYAVTPTTVAGISGAWKHFIAWLKISRYTHGPHQCLEEHLSPAETPNDKTQIDLYLPLTRTS
ncbi:MAG: AraC family transcriptional regulator [candidate division Zixibacteria bacterium]|nr:AraC family transcriptional regulator [candidate division Zixibacteria bacterium]